MKNHGSAVVQGHTKPKSLQHIQREERNRQIDRERRRGEKEREKRERERERERRERERGKEREEREIEERERDRRKSGREKREREREIERQERERRRDIGKKGNTLTTKPRDAIYPHYETKNRCTYFIYIIPAIPLCSPHNPVNPYISVQETTPSQGKT